MQLSIESIQKHLPAYLSAERQAGIERALREFPVVRKFYINAYRGELLQGDCWKKLTALNFGDGARKKIRGMIISNSCSVDSENSRVLPLQLIFVPLLKLETVRLTMQRAGKSPEQIDTTIAAIRRQAIDSFFYLPQGAGIDEESVGWLDQVHTMPVSAFEQEDERSKLATLSDASFWLFVLKLSIYFTRLHENVDRSDAVDVA